MARQFTPHFLIQDGEITGATAHDGLTGLNSDDHAQYANINGRAGGQTIKGGTASGEDLTLQSTAHATRGNVIAADPLLSRVEVEANLAAGATPDTLTPAESGKTITNTGATTRCGYVLPDASAANIGCWYHFVCVDDDGLDVNPDAGDTIYVGENSTMNLLRVTSVGSSVTLLCVAVDYWMATSSTGTVTLV